MSKLGMSGGRGDASGASRASNGGVPRRVSSSP